MNDDEMTYDAKKTRFINEHQDQQGELSELAQLFQEGKFVRSQK